MASLNQTIFRDAVIVNLISLSGQAIGFVVTMFTAKHFGAGWQTDAWYLAITIPTVVCGIISGILKLVFVPVFVEERIKNADSVPATVRAAVSWMLLLSMVGCAAVWGGAEAGWLELGSTPSMHRLVRALLLETLPLIPLSLLGTIFYSIYQSYQHFGWAEAVMALRSIPILAAIVGLAPTWGVHSLAIGNLVGQGMVTLLLALLVRIRLGLCLAPGALWTPVMRRMISLSGYPALTMLLAQARPLITRLMAASLPTGALSALSYAERLATIPMLLIGHGFMGVFVSHWSKSTAEGAEEETERSLNRALSMLLTVVLPAVTILIVLRSHLVRLAFRRGVFDEKAVLLTVTLFMILVMTAIPEYCSMLLGRMLTVRKAMRTIFGINAISLAIVGGGGYLLAIRAGWGAEGVAWATLISTVWVAAAGATTLHGLGCRIDLGTIAYRGMGSAVGCVGMALSVKAIQLFAVPHLALPKTLWGLLGETVLLGGAGVAIYVAYLFFVRHPDAEAIRTLWYKRRQGIERES